MEKIPKVSILCLAYNQYKYIGQTIESFMEQKADFSFEILINDDASTDGTAKIIKSYEKRYPGVIKGIYHNENEYSQGKRGLIARNLLPIAKGDYITLCDGDDYYTDNSKLSLQVEFLEKNIDFSICFHGVYFFYENNELPSGYYPKNKDIRKFTNKQLVLNNFIPMNSDMYRRLEYKNLPVNVFPEDWYLHLYHARYGKIGYIDRVMSNYRRHAAGVWWNANNNYSLMLKKHGYNYMALFLEIIKLYYEDENIRKLLLDKIIELKYNMKVCGISFDKFLENHSIDNCLEKEIIEKESRLSTFFKVHIFLRIYRKLNSILIYLRNVLYKKFTKKSIYRN